MKALGGGALLLGLFKLISVIPSSASLQVVRPPGAVDEVRFKLLCVRCGICLEVCPTHIIVLGGIEDGIEVVDTPKLDPSIGSCEFIRGRCEEAALCSKFCPTGALQPVHKNQVKLGTAEFNPAKCLAYKGKECVVCYEMCPVTNAITLIKDQVAKPVFHGSECVGCGTCVHYCPADPKALSLLPEGVKRVRWSE